MNKIKRIIAAVVLCIVGVATFAASTAPTTVSASSGCRVGGETFPNPDLVHAWCSGLNNYSPYLGQSGEMVRAIARCQTSPSGGTVEPTWRTGPWQHKVESGTTELPDSTIDCSPSYPYIGSGYMQAETTTWSLTTCSGAGYSYDGVGYLAGRSSCNGLDTANGQWQRVLVRCYYSGSETLGPIRYGNKVYVSGNDSLYWCNGLSGEGEYAAVVNYEVGYN